jgi:diguanylate cyclase (GGDEF)-like protein
VLKIRSEASSAAKQTSPAAKGKAGAQTKRSGDDSSTQPLAELDLTAALLLLERAGHQLPGNLPAQSAQWVQAVIQGLCDLSSRDALTGLPNRRQFELTLDRELDRVARMGEPALVLMADIDHFKKVNDTYGHQVGDQVLKMVAGVLAENIRPMDTVARLGGEEFGFVLPNCPPMFGQTVAERMRSAVEARRITLPSGQQLGVTLSLGGAYAPQWVRSSGALWMERADRQLYRAKHNGRNCALIEQAPILQVTAEEKGLLFSTSPEEDTP